MEKEKYVDESWKDNVAQEKQKKGDEPIPAQQEKKILETGSAGTSKDTAEDHSEDMEVNFFNYVTSLIYQTFIFLGEVPNPMADNKIELNLKQAKFLIDTLILLREKTKGNLDQAEENLLNGSIYELQLKFVEHSQNQTASGKA